MSTNQLETIDGSVADSESLRNPMVLCDRLIDATEGHVAAKSFRREEQVDDYRLACDAFNLWRIKMLCDESLSGEEASKCFEAVRDLVCVRRSYVREELDLAMEATRDRAKLPFAVNPLLQAIRRASGRRIQVNAPELSGFALVGEILSIAIELEQLNSPRPVFLPVDQLARLLGRRKTTVAGAIKLLLRRGLLKEVGKKPHTGRAREVQVQALQGVHYNRVP